MWADIKFQAVETASRPGRENASAHLARSIDWQPFGERSQIAAENSGNPAHLFEGRVPLASFHATHVAAVDFRVEGKTFLRKPFRFAGSADSLPERTKRRVFFQHLTVLADEDLSSTDYNPHFALASCWGICQTRATENGARQFNVPIQGKIMKTESSLYKRRGKPERAMAEIRRTLLRKISTQIAREGLPDSPSGTYPDLADKIRHTSKIGEILPKKSKADDANLACKTSMPPKQS